MGTRIQNINNDTVLEVTEMVPVKTRHSENELLNRKQYFETMLVKCQEGLEEVNTLLATIQNERDITI